MLDLAIFLILVLIILSLGRKIFRTAMRGLPVSFIQGFFINFGLGAGTLALAVLCVGMAGLLYRWVIGLVLACLAVILARDIKNNIYEIAAWVRKLAGARFLVSERLLILVLILVWSFALAGALTPLLGTDSASYHMRDPKVFISLHKIAHIPYTRESLWPFLVQMLFTLGLLLKGQVLAKLFNFGFGIFSILGIYCFCRRYWARKDSLTACTIFALIPAVFTSVKYAYTDLAVVFYTVLSFYLFFIWLDTKENRWFYLSAAACGFLLGIKITSLIVPAIILTLYVFEKVREKGGLKEKIYPLTVFMLIFAAISSVWYLRPWVILGNPVYPFAANLFGGHGYPEEFLRYHATSGIGIGITQYVRMLWPLTLYPDNFGGESIGPIFLIFLPMLVFLRKPSRFIKYVIFIAFALYTSWFIVYQYVRFFYPSLIFLSILVAYIFAAICKNDKALRIYAVIVVGLVFCFSFALSVYHNLENIPFVFGAESQRGYLLKHERSYAMAEYVNSNLPPDARIMVFGKPDLFYFDRYAADVFCYKMDTRYDKSIQDADFAKYLVSQGFRYAIFTKDNTPGRNTGPSLDPESILGQGNIVLLKETDFSYRDERYVYQLWEIRAGGR